MKCIELVVMEQSDNLAKCHLPCIECGEIYRRMINVRMIRPREPHDEVIGGLYCWKCVLRLAHECTDACVDAVKD